MRSLRRHRLEPNVHLAAPSLALLLMINGTSFAQTTVRPDPIPEWLTVRMSTAEDLSFDHESPLKISFETTLSELHKVQYKLTFPPEVQFLDGEREGSLNLAAGSPHVITVTIRIARPMSGQSLVCETRVPLPREALVASVETAYGEETPERARGLNYIAQAGDTQVFIETVTLSSTPEETWTSREGIVFESYVNSREGRRFPLYQTMPGVETSELDRREVEVEKAIELYSRPPSTEGTDAFTQLKENAVLDRFNIRYQRVIILLNSGNAREAHQAESHLEVPSAHRSPLLLAALNVLRATIAFQLEEVERARTLLEETLDELGRDPVTRYVHYSLGEIHASTGRGDEARKSYRRALSLKASYTQAQRRLDGK